MIEMFKKHINKILVLFCIIGMIMAPDNASFAVMCLCLIAVMLKWGGHTLQDVLIKWWISGKWK
tara:strand:- start:1092 stop:1283 length:192 start_codon:yes stop_codon:yes gene_type:complete